MKTVILLVNLGTPDEPSRYAVYKYLKEFLLDYRVIDIPSVPRNLLVRGIIAPFRSGSSAKLYQELWTDEGSPLKVYGISLRDKLQVLMGDNYIVSLAMRYQEPSLKGALNDLLSNKSINELIVVPLFPQYSSACTGSIHEVIMKQMARKQVIPKVTFINSFYDHEAFLQCFLDRINQYDPSSYDHILFSYHGLPVSQLRKADMHNHCTKQADCCHNYCEANHFCYSAQCVRTTELLAERLGLDKDKFTTCFQSRLGPTKWVEPYTSDILKKRAELGEKRLLCVCPAFVADCLETIIEIGEEYQEEFEEMGGEVIQLVHSLNADDDWVTAMKQIIHDA